ISDAVAIPIFLQDAGNPTVPPDLSRQIAEESERVRYIKVESTPPAEKVAEAVAQLGDVLTVFGGAGGNTFIEELRHGSQGTMPSCSQPEAFVEVWDCFQRGDEPGARAVFDRKIAPVNAIALRGWGALFHVNKEILRQRGVIRCAKVRGPMEPLDKPTTRELMAGIGELDGGAGGGGKGDEDQGRSGHPLPGSPAVILERPGAPGNPGGPDPDAGRDGRRRRGVLPRRARPRGSGWADRRRAVAPGR